MAVVNTCVTDFSTKRTLLPWTIMLLGEESYTFNDFFTVSVMPRIPEVTTSCRLLSAYVGPKKNDASLDFVDVHLHVLPVITSFGRFLKYHVEYENSTVATEIEMTTDSSAQHTAHRFVTPLVNVRNKREKLFNDLISLFVSHNALLEDHEVDTLGNELVTTIVTYCGMWTVTTMLLQREPFLLLTCLIHLQNITHQSFLSIVKDVQLISLQISCKTLH